MSENEKFLFPMGGEARRKSVISSAYTLTPTLSIEGWTVLGQAPRFGLTKINQFPINKRILIKLYQWIEVHWVRERNLHWLLAG